jgi:hypothetical protein
MGENGKKPIRKGTSPMKKTLLLALAAALAALTLTGCGTAAASAPATPAASAPDASAMQSAPAASASAADAAALSGADTAWLPAGVKQLQGEKEPDAAVEKAIVDYYQIPQEDRSSTRYFYNRVDLNGDGTDEILAVVLGPYTSGTGGDSALWLLPNADMAVNQAFTLVRTPIVISDTMTNGAHELLVRRSGGGAAAETERLTCSDGSYTAIPDAPAAGDISAVTGMAVLCDDMTLSAGGGHALSAGK